MKESSYGKLSSVKVDKINCSYGFDINAPSFNTENKAHVSAILGPRETQAGQPHLIPGKAMELILEIISRHMKDKKIIKSS